MRDKRKENILVLMISYQQNLASALSNLAKQTLGQILKGR